jgi:DNA repair protein RadC
LSIYGTGEAGSEGIVRHRREGTQSAADRPREKLARVGAGGLGDTELLALVLGQGGRGRSSLALAGALLARAGGVTGLPGVMLDDLRQEDGIGTARAAQVVAAIELGRRTLCPAPARQRFARPSDCAEWLLPQFGGRPVEQFGVVLLDARRGLMAARIVSTGSVDASTADPRAILREAILARAAGVVVFHNHPSGDPTPSSEDVAVTRRLVAAATIVGIELVDHLILGAGRYFSFREHSGPSWKA